MDSQDYYSDEQSDHGEGVTKYTPPTPPRPRNGEGAFRVVIDPDEDLDLIVYFSPSEDDSIDEFKGVKNFTSFPNSEKPYVFSDHDIYFSDCEDDTRSVCDSSVTSDIPNNCDISNSDID